jgi:CRP-like cAMP-binding protein
MSSPAPRSLIGLRNVALFKGLADDALGELADQCSWRRYLSDQQVISREASDRDVYFVIAGRLRVTAFSAGGRQVTYRDVVAGDWFGDFAAIDGKARSADVVAVDESLVAAMPAPAFRRLLESHREILDRMLLRLVGSIRELTDRVFDLSTLGVQNRVHAEILRLAREAGVAANRARIDPIPKHADIASRISTYREQVSRELSTMQKLGLLRRDGRALLVPDVARLQRIVDEVRRTT